MLQWFDRRQLERLWDEHERMQRDNGLKLFGLLTVAMFLASTAKPQAPASSKRLMPA